jgi:hypothetical protein
MGDEAAENLRLMIEFAKRGQVPQIEGFLEEQVPINGVDHLGCTGTVSSFPSPIAFSCSLSSQTVTSMRNVLACCYTIRHFETMLEH